MDQRLKNLSKNPKFDLTSDLKSQYIKWDLEFKLKLDSKSKTWSKKPKILIKSPKLDQIKFKTPAGTRYLATNLNNNQKLV